MWSPAARLSLSKMRKAWNIAGSFLHKMGRVFRRHRHRRRFRVESPLWMLDGQVLSRQDRHGGRCERLALGGLSTPSTGSDFGRARLDQRCCGRFLGNDRSSDLGPAGRAGLPVPTASGLCRRGTHPGPGRPEPLGDPISRSCRRSYPESVSVEAGKGIGIRETDREILYRILTPCSHAFEEASGIFPGSRRLGPRLPSPLPIL
jgi:hypothetical protein